LLLLFVLGALGTKITSLLHFTIKAALYQ